MGESSGTEQDGTAKKNGGKLFLYGVAGFFALVFLGNGIAKVVDPEGYAAMEKEIEAERLAEEEQEAASAQAADQAGELERQKGLHCLSGWDGANRSTKTQVQAALRNPDSFEHIDTAIYPNDDGEHGLWMTYRAENGFGGMNVERMYARVDHDTCEAGLLPGGPGSG